MDITKMENKIASATGNLQPIILNAILNVYNRGLQQITASEVKEECSKIDNSVSWNRRIPAICNAMRNATECGGRINREENPSNDFTISFDGNISNSDLITKKINHPINLLQKNNKSSIIEQKNSKNNELFLSENYKVVMICAGSKVSNSELIIDGNLINWYRRLERTT